MFNPYLKYFFKQEFRKNFESKGIANFFDFDAAFLNNELASKEPAYWEKLGENMALQLFKEAGERVPAYRDFLKKNKINPALVKTMKDFKQLPLIDKKNYFEIYPLEKMCWDGKIANNTLLSSSSGSSGAPFFWPRGEELELETSILHEMFLKHYFKADKKSTLFVVIFNMGVSIAGVITLDSVLRTAEKPYPLTTITPGLQESDILRVLKELSPKFEQTILAGYPPFIKDIIDRAIYEEIDLKRINLKFLFATEGFNEEWRDYLFKEAKIDDVLNSSINIYGSSEAAILGHETPLSIFLRRLCRENKVFRQQLFCKEITPTFVQYNPMLKFFEVVEDELIFSSYAGLPLIRYNIRDNGGLISFSTMMNILEDNKIMPKENNFVQNTLWKLPFIYIFGKSDSSVNFYGLKIPVENIKNALKTDILKNLTGKFVMRTKHRENQEEYWEIIFELQEGKKPTKILKEKIKKSAITTLRKQNLEYGALYKGIGKRAEPEIILKPKGDPEYFPLAAKHKWSKKEV